MKLNKEWHLTHPMPKNPSIEQRIEWHIEVATAEFLKECLYISLFNV